MQCLSSIPGMFLLGLLWPAPVLAQAVTKNTLSVVVGGGVLIDCCSAPIINSPV